MKLAAKLSSSVAICEQTAEPSMTMMIWLLSAGHTLPSAGSSTTWRKASKRLIANAAAASS